MAVRAGKRALLRGEMSLQDGDYRGARDALRSSQESFLEATALREATRATGEES